MSDLSRREILSATFGAALIGNPGRAVAALTESVDVPAPVEPLTLNAALANRGEPPRLLQMGTFTRPDGRTLKVDSQCLLLDGRPWLPVMGEFHYSRYPADEWVTELKKLKAGGLDIVASYVFWIHHEEVEGVWDWSGRRDLRAFVEACAEAGLFAVVRCGPWAHGEVRNGGFPDWLQKKGIRLRSDDPKYLSEAKRLYEAIAEQLSGLLWKDGGLVIGIQCENEFGGPAQHLLTLKKLAFEAGLDVPMYTRTGWPRLSTPMPPGEFLPLSGAYAEGFWDRELTPMPGSYGDGFRFILESGAGTGAIGTDQLGSNRASGTEAARYPYLCCELGGGMAVSYHRRLDVTPADVESTALVKIGSGNNLQGYYMVHGGTNPPGKLSTLQESQATAYWNDLPVKTYDFQTLLGEFGQVRPHYHGLRRLHLVLRDWGTQMARQDAFLPDIRPRNSKDTATLRWSVRTDGRHGALFVNNYQRGQSMPAHKDVRFEVRLPDAGITLPSRPISVPANREFFFPLGLDLGGVHLQWATAQPICYVQDGLIRTVFFAQITGISAEFAFQNDVKILGAKGQRLDDEGTPVIRDVPTGTDVAILLQGPNDLIRIVLLDEVTSRACWKGIVGGKERVLLSPDSLVFHQDGLLVTSEKRPSVAMYPAPRQVRLNQAAIAGKADGIFTRYSLAAPSENPTPRLEAVRAAGPARKVTMGSQKVAEAPSDADFATAAVWRILIGPTKGEVLLRIRYAGDVARLYAEDEFLTDNFYNGRPFEFGLWRTDAKELRLEILPLRKDAPIYLEHPPAFGSEAEIAKVLGIELVPCHRQTLLIE
jgi:beta-galactosidase